MTEEQVPQLSALIDGELPARPAGALIDAVCRDPALRGAWERYHLIGQVLRGERVDPGVRALADAVRGRLASEPVVRGAPRSPRRGTRRRSWRPPFGAAALAAALALLAVFAAPGLYRGGHPDQGRTLAALGATPPAPAWRRWETDHPELAGRLDLFLLAHQEAAPPGGVKGMLPYATLVGDAAGR